MRPAGGASHRACIRERRAGLPPTHLWRRRQWLEQRQHTMATSLCAVGTLPAARLQQQRRPAQQQQLSSAFLGGSVQQAAAPLRPFAASSGSQQQRRVTCMAAKGELGGAPGPMRVARAGAAPVGKRSLPLAPPSAHRSDRHDQAGAAGRQGQPRAARGPRARCQGAAAPPPPALRRPNSRCWAPLACMRRAGGVRRCEAHAASVLPVPGGQRSCPQGGAHGLCRRRSRSTTAPLRFPRPLLPPNRRV